MDSERPSNIRVTRFGYKEFPGSDPIMPEAAWELPPSAIVDLVEPWSDTIAPDPVWDLPSSAIVDLVEADGNALAHAHDTLPILDLLVEDPCIKLGGPNGLTAPAAQLKVINPSFTPAQTRETSPAALSSRTALEQQLAEVRKIAEFAGLSQDRTNEALYRAIGGAFDLALTADDAPDEFAALLVRAGLELSKRAPMTPIVKLVFGSGYDKTRLAEYVAALDHGRRLQIARGRFGLFLAETSGGLKAVVKAERQLRREEKGGSANVRTALNEAVAGKLRTFETQSLDNLANDGEEFALVLTRRLPTGELVVVAKVPRSVAMLDQSAKAILNDKS